MRKLFLYLIFIFAFQNVYSNDIDALFNIGQKSLKLGNYENATTAFNKVLTEQGLSGALLDNDKLSEVNCQLGESLLRSSKYQDAIDAYKKSLNLNENNEQAKKGLDLAQKFLKEQEQQEQQEKQKQDQQDKNKDKQDQDQKDQEKDNQNQDGQDQKDQKNKDEQEQKENMQEDQQDKQDSEGEQSKKDQEQEKKEDSSKQEQDKQDGGQAKEEKDQQKKNVEAVSDENLKNLNEQEKKVLEIIEGADSMKDFTEIQMLKASKKRDSSGKKNW